MKKKIIFLATIVTIVFAYSFTNKVSADTQQKEIIVNRVYNPNTGEHLFTPSVFEESYLIDKGWKGEGNAFFVPDNPLFVNTNLGPYIQRLYNPNAGEHFYTANDYEASSLVKKGWRRDLVTIPTAKTGVPVYRLYNPNARVGSHHYTVNTYERNNLINHGWKFEGIAFYVLH